MQKNIEHFIKATGTQQSRKKKLPAAKKHIYLIYKIYLTENTENMHIAYLFKINNHLKLAMA